ncbi:hypothetical protein FB45DRAFT_147588 [Roridomyces roridus]|uniref:Uncharacterized protein n=1 Tax=Roridomyces roridus TaxID=1738132 RepID=A0AAD7FEY0_9AGAR|nr:hypothetical protein FB45DRAFT_147588 [Roridomyces roridus]
MSSFTRAQTEFITKFHAALFAKCDTCSPAEMARFKNLFKDHILASPLFQGADVKAGDRIMRHFGNAISRRRTPCLVKFYPLPGGGLFEQENKSAILAKAQESEHPDDVAFEFAALEMWSALGAAVRDDYEVRAALLGNTVEASVPFLLESDPFDDPVQQERDRLWKSRN